MSPFERKKSGKTPSAAAPLTLRALEPRLLLDGAALSATADALAGEAPAAQVDAAVDALV